jgi:hypothetical protein
MKSKISASWQMIDFFVMHHYNGDSQALKCIKFHKKQKIPSINNHLKMANVQNTLLGLSFWEIMFSYALMTIFLQIINQNLINEELNIIRNYYNSSNIMEF